jgi:hypothetical protein
MDESETIKKSYDITDFINKNKTLLISDFEGTTPKEHFKQFENYCTKEQVIFLGDVFDNTAQYSKNCDGNDCKDPDATESICLSDDNYCALKTIKLLVDNKDKCRYVFGNRDINKIKLLPFFSIEDNEGREVKWWQEQKQEEKEEAKDDDISRYANIVKNLLTMLDEKDESDNNRYKWMINGADVKYFRPFWKKDSKDYIDNTIWMNDNPEDINKIYNRFELIFGKDASIGTMSALVTLKCIPNEVIGSGTNMNKFYNLVTDTTDNSEEKRREIRAALTIAIFMRMLDKELWDKNDNKKKAEFKVSNFGALDGYLYYYLMNAPAAYYGEIDKNLFLFAHGGITNDFVEKGGRIKKETIVGWDEIVKNKQGGGDKIKTQIDFYNKECDNLLRNFFNRKSVLNKIVNNKFTDINVKKWWVGPMLSLLDISAGTKTNPNQRKDASDEILDTYAGDYDKLFNVFGHASVSSGYTIGKSKKSEKTYFINTDFSTTLFKAGIACDGTYNDNYLLLILDPTGEGDLKLTCEGKIYLNTKYEVKNEIKNEPYTIENIDTIHTTIDKDKPKLIAPESIKPIEFDSDENLINIIDEVNDMNKTKHFCFNGMVKIGEKQYLMLSSKFSRDYNTSIALIPYEKVAVSEVADAEDADANAGGRKQRASKYKVKRKTKRNRKTKRISKSKSKSKSKGKKGRKTKKGGRKTRRKSSN